MVVLPSVHLSPESREFIQSILEVNYCDRLGFVSDSEIKRAPFFKTIDWENTIRLECAPAFIPPTRCVTLEERQSVLMLGKHPTI